MSWSPAASPSWSAVFPFLNTEDSNANQPQDPSRRSRSNPSTSRGGDPSMRRGSNQGDKGDRDRENWGSGAEQSNVDWAMKCVGLGRNPPDLPPHGASSREIMDAAGADDELPLIRNVRYAYHEACRKMAESKHCKAGLLVLAAVALIMAGVLLLTRGSGTPNFGPNRMPVCKLSVPCPADWRKPGGAGGFYCEEINGCQAFASGPFAGCLEPCFIYAPGGPAPPSLRSGHVTVDAPAAGDADAAATSTELTKAGYYDLRVKKNGKLLGCAAPVGKFPGQPKYGCAGDFATAETCDAAKHPIKDTKYVQAVHDGCETAMGRGTYGYAYDDGVGLKQCAPVTKYEWVLCPEGTESGIMWQAETGISVESTKRFRVTNKCKEPIWIQQAGAGDEVLPGEEAIKKIEPYQYHTYSIPDKGLPSTRFLPKTGCNSEGNDCDIQSMPPCPTTGCDLPIDTKFEASWGCQFSTGNVDEDKERCSLTGQGNPSTYQDWWDGSAVDGWTLPFSVLVDDGGHGLAPGMEGSPDICGPVVCANLEAEKICPTDEFLTPETE